MSEQPPPSRMKRLDARTLRALAHPVRVEALALLRGGGPATASGLAERLGESSGTLSWHLRQLAEAGFIEEDSERGNRRERWWRARHEFTQVEPTDFMEDPEAGAALKVFLHQILEGYARKAATFVSQTYDWDREWIEAADLSDWEIPLTAAELGSLRDELQGVVRRYRRNQRPGDLPVAVQMQLFPRRRTEGEM